MSEKNGDFERLLDHIRASRGVDFSHYRSSSLQRRIFARMQELEIHGYVKYLEHLRARPDEFAPLLGRIFLNLTGFFRDPEAWRTLDREILPEVIENAKDRDEIRIWCARVASGEEAYSLVMLFAERLGISEARKRLEVHATDLDEEALLQGRRASYAPEALRSVPEALRERYFEVTGARRSFRSDLRATVSFRRHDLLEDPPIPRLDLLVCRNTLMYLDAEAQSEVLDRFHGALEESGFLFLGRAELPLSRRVLFTPRSLEMRIFEKLRVAGGERREYVLAEVGSGSESRRVAGIWLGPDAVPEAVADALPMASGRGDPLPLAGPRSPEAREGEADATALDPAVLESGIRLSRARLDSIRDRIREESSAVRTVALEALEELEHTLEELRVAEEEQRLQNEALLAQQQLLEVEHARYRELFELAPTAYLVTTPTGVVRDANHAACRLLGVALELLRGERLHTLASPEERGEFRRHVGSLASEPALREWETTMRVQDSRPIPVNVRAASIRGPRGRTIGIRWILRDMSQEKRLEEQRRELIRAEAAREAAARAAGRARFLERTGEILARNLDAAAGLDEVAQHVVSEFCHGFAVYAIAEDGIRRLALAYRDLESEALLGDFEERFHLSPGDLESRLGRLIRGGQSVILAETSGSNGAPGQRVLAARGETEADGPRRVMVLPLSGPPSGDAVRGAVVFLNADRGPGFDREDYVLAQELTYRIELDLENGRLYREIQRNLKVRKEVARVVSHDLRNALQVVAVYVDHLLEGPGSERRPEADRRYLKPIGQAVDRMRYLIEDLWRTTEPEVDWIRLDRKPEEIEPLLDDAVGLFRQLAEDRGVRLRVDGDRDLPPVSADRERLLQVFSNLLGNALKCTERGGWVAVRAERAEPFVRFAVADNGCGIAEDELERLLRNAAEPRDGEERGGLGLAIVRRIVEAHRGRLTAESRPGAGATFYFTVPVAEDRPPA